MNEFDRTWDMDASNLTRPLRWRKSARCRLDTDLFHESLTDEAIDKVFAVMALCPQHTFQVLTKRADRMRAYFSGTDVLSRLKKVAVSIRDNEWDEVLCEIPLPNVWLGVSAERQQEADERIPHLLQTPAAIRFVSAEPLLGPIDLMDVIPNPIIYNAVHGMERLLDWVIVGGESGGPNARPMHPEWARSLRDQCKATGVSFFFKQWGEWAPHTADIEQSDGSIKTTPKHGIGWRAHVPGGISGMFRVGKKAAGRLLDGREHNDFPTTTKSGTGTV